MYRLVLLSKFSQMRFSNLRNVEVLNADACPRSCHKCVFVRKCVIVCIAIYVGVRALNVCANVHTFAAKIKAF